MADITITPASVVKGAGAAVRSNFNAGEAITAGQVVYKKAADGEWYKAQNDGTAEEAGVGVELGIALHPSADGQPLVVQTAGLVTIGGTLVPGTEYVVSATAGAIAPHADLTTPGRRYTRLGYATTTTVLSLDIIATGIVLV